MSEHRALRGGLAITEAVFPALSRANFASSYPEGPHKLRHNLSAHPLLELGERCRRGRSNTTAATCRSGRPTAGQC